MRRVRHAGRILRAARARCGEGALRAMATGSGVGRGGSAAMAPAAYVARSRRETTDGSFSARRRRGGRKRIKRAGRVEESAELSAVQDEVHARCVVPGATLDVNVRRSPERAAREIAPARALAVAGRPEAPGGGADVAEHVLGADGAPTELPSRKVKAAWSRRGARPPSRRLGRRHRRERRSAGGSVRAACSEISRTPSSIEQRVYGSMVPNDGATALRVLPGTTTRAAAAGAAQRERLGHLVGRRPVAGRDEAERRHRPGGRRRARGGACRACR